MIIALDHFIFGNGHGLKSPHFDSAFYWLKGEFYTFSGGFGAQLHSFQWTHPKPGERRTLLGREFVVFQSYRRFLRVRVSWAMVHQQNGVNEELAEINSLRAALQSI
jgi:hypothetical protein